ncbi:hypothetical protein DYBT9275_05855 [Dyadobacter sp. CECT 9275]|uniref:Short NACHT-associated C-terminal domain-containing protein n=1 Tax=Dyadobacter helix TaxID=2822344 RepID=A0A916N8Q7_9BACT|nr:hypothetical protein DYBT9275_05855 [Dyadobacter sp. CECT 9275]
MNDYNGSFENLIADKILKSKIKPNEITFNRTLESGNFLFILDGYDEIFSSKKQIINREIELFVDAYSRNNFIITSRPGSGIENFPRFYDFAVKPLTDDDVKGFISKIVKDTERKSRIYSLIKDPKNNGYLEYLRNPLLLSMFIMTFENHPEIPNKKSSFYRNVFDTLYSKHDGWTKNSFPREKLTKLQQDDFEQILRTFSYLTMIEGHFTFTYEYISDKLTRIRNNVDVTFIVSDLISDLRTSISILLLDGFEYYFPHRSMQEYFAALFISKLPSDKKKIAYNNLSVTFRNSSNDNNSNFWSLCTELDESLFNKYFLIPNLQKIYNRIKGKNGRHLLDEYIKICEPLLYPSTIINDKVTETRLFTEDNFNTSILEFIKSNHSLYIYIFVRENKELNQVLINIFSEISLKPDILNSIYVSKNENLFEILLENEIIPIIEDLRSFLDVTIKQLKQNIKKQKISIDDLLKS